MLQFEEEMLLLAPLLVAEKAEKKVLLDVLALAAAAAPRMLLKLLLVPELLRWSLRTNKCAQKLLVVSAVDPPALRVSVLTSPRSAELCYMSSTRKKKFYWFLRR